MGESEIETGLLSEVKFVKLPCIFFAVALASKFEMVMFSLLKLSLPQFLVFYNSNNHCSS